MSRPSDNNSLPAREHFLGIENRNFLSPIGFQFTIDKLKGVDFFCQSASVPSISMDSADTGTRLNKLRHPGDELQYEDLYIKFLVDENMKNWYQVHDWMREMTTPYSTKEFKYSRGTIKSANEGIPDATRRGSGRISGSLMLLCLFCPVTTDQLLSLSSEMPFPISLTTLNFDSSVPDISYFTAEVVLRYNYYDYYIMESR